MEEEVKEPKISEKEIKAKETDYRASIALAVTGLYFSSILASIAVFKDLQSVLAVAAILGQPFSLIVGFYFGRRP